MYGCMHVCLKSMYVCMNEEKARYRMYVCMYVCYVVVVLRLDEIPAQIFVKCWCSRRNGMEYPMVVSRLS